MAGSVKVDSIPYDFYSLQCHLSQDGEPFALLKGIEEIEYSATINREKRYGSSRTPVDRTEGDAEFEASMTLHRDQYTYILAKARARGIPIARLSMTLAVTYYVSGFETQTDTLVGVALQEIGNSHSRGPDPLQVSVSLDVMNIFYNGVDVFGTSLS